MSGRLRFEDAAADHRGAIEAVVRAVEAVDPGRVVGAPQPGKWSPAEIAQHLIKVWISAVAGGPAVQLIADDSYQDAPTWSPDGNWIAYALSRAGRRALAKVKVGAGEAALVLKEGIVYPSNPKWSPNGAYITCDTPEGFASSSAPTASRAERWPRRHLSPTPGPGTAAGRLRDAAATSCGFSSSPSTWPRAGKRSWQGSRPVPAQQRSRLAGLSLAPDGRVCSPSIVRLRGDVWLLSGFEARTPGVFERLLPGTERPGSP